MMLETALSLRKMGVSVAPITNGTKHFNARAMNERGYTLAKLKETLPEVSDLEYWFKNDNQRLAIICKDIVALDFDNWPVYSKFKKKYPTFAYTWTIKTPRGVHLYYQVENSDVGLLKCDWPLTEIKYGGKAIITAGEGYKTISSGLLCDYTILKIRDALVLPVVDTTATPPPSLRSVGSPTKKKGGSRTFSFVGHTRERSDRVGRVASEVLITDYLMSIGHTVRKAPKGWITNCPFLDNHKNKDANPSFWVTDNADKQLCNCYKPGCASSKPMDYIALYARINDISNGEAYKLLVKPEGTRKKTRKEKRESEALEEMTRLMSR